MKTSFSDLVYDLSLPPTQVTSASLRAELVRGDPWVDLHYSRTAPLAPAAARAKLLEILKSLRIRGK